VTRPVAGRAVAVGVGSLAARVAYAGLRRRAGDGSRWERINHRGRTLTLLEGPALATGAAAAVALTPALPARARAAAAIAILGAGAIGAYDDLGGLRTQQAKGFAGHLAALREGRVTSGAVKAVGIGTTSLVAAALVSRGPRDALLGGAVVAGFANLVNLFDLRPGRAIKVGLLHAPLIAVPGAGGALLAVRHAGPDRPPRRTRRADGRQREDQLHPGHRLHPAPAVARRTGPHRPRPRTVNGHDDTPAP